MLEDSRKTTADGLRSRSVGLWVSACLLAAPIGMVAGGQPATEAHATEYVETIEAGPIDDTLDYIDCLIKRLQDLPCPKDTQPEGKPDSPAEPIDEPPPPVWPG